jgi:hypothetical protein
MEDSVVMPELVRLAMMVLLPADGTRVMLPLLLTLVVVAGMMAATLEEVDGKCSRAFASN